MASRQPRFVFHPNVLIRVVFFSALTLHACDDDSDGGLDLGRAREYAELRCAKMFACCNPTFAYDDEADCVDSVYFQFWYLDHIGLKVDPDELAACLDARVAQVTGECDDPYRRHLDECALVFEGPLGAGSPCTLVEQCGRGLYCAATGADLNERYCVRQKKEGSSCDRNRYWSSAECQAGLVCMEQETGDRCQPPLPAGGSCTWSFECGSEYDPDLQCVFGRCGPRLPDGAPCDADHPDWCRSGHCAPEESVCTVETLQAYCEAL
jgi:hypothetical protein